MARYARICSNKNNWVYPDLSIKPDTHLSHPGKYGFGFDEWTKMTQFSLLTYGNFPVSLCVKHPLSGKCCVASLLSRHTITMHTC